MLFLCTTASRHFKMHVLLRLPSRSGDSIFLRGNTCLPKFGNYASFNQDKLGTGHVNRTLYTVALFTSTVDSEFLPSKRENNAWLRQFDLKTIWSHTYNTFAKLVHEPDFELQSMTMLFLWEVFCNNRDFIFRSAVAWLGRIRIFKNTFILRAQKTMKKPQNRTPIRSLENRG